MRILQINANYGFGSTGLIMRNIGDSIEESGYEAFYAYQRCVDRPINGFVVGNKFDWTIHALACRFLGRQGFYSRVLTRRFLRKLDFIKPDIVHLHNLHSNFINIELLCQYLAEHDIPTVITMHDCWFFTGKCFHYVDCGCDKFITGCGNCPKQFAPPASLIRDTSAKDWNVKNIALNRIPRLYIVGCSKWIANEAKKSFLQRKQISYIYNGVDTSIFRPVKSNLKDKLRLPHNSFIVLGMANKWTQIRNKKAFDSIVGIENICVVIVGCSPAEKALIEHSYKDYNNVFAIGFVGGREELAELYSMADVFVNLTHADTLPTVNMECICCGTPVITYDVGGSPELVDERTGIVVHEDNVDSLVNAIHTVRTREYSKCAEIGKQKFDKSTCYSEYLSLYKKICN